MADCGSCCARRRRRISASGGAEFQKPPRSVPTWEKRFCWEVGSLPWKRIEDAKRYIHDTHCVVRWNDSAGEEAFNEAKLRYWLKINGLPCRISPRSPDIYIDKIDWNPNNNCIESELLQCLDEASGDKEEEEEKGKKTLDVAFDQIKPTGWDYDIGEVFDQRNRFLTGMVVGE